MTNLKRRTFIGVAASGLLIASLGAHAQQRGKRFRIGMVDVGTREAYAPLINAFEETLRELGWVGGSNVVYEYRWAQGMTERLPSLAAELARLPVDVIVVGTNPSISAAKRVTSTIPIVMCIAVAPVEHGFIASLARPGGNVTGLTYDSGPEVYGKSLGLLKEIVPGLAAVGLLAQQGVGAHLAAVKVAAQRVGLKLEVVDMVQAPDEIDAAFATMKRAKVGAYLGMGGPLIYAHRQHVAKVALENRLPGIHFSEDYVDAGALASYGAKLVDRYRSAATYVDKILRGAKPADLPVEQPTRYYLTINLKTAAALGLTIPQSVLLRTDDVIR